MQDLPINIVIIEGCVKPPQIVCTDNKITKPRKVCQKQASTMFFKTLCTNMRPNILMKMLPVSIIKIIKRPFWGAILL